MRKTSINIPVVVLALVTLSVSVCFGSGEPLKRAVTIKGVNSVAALIKPWLSEFELEHPDIKLVLYPSTRGGGFESLLDGTADICMTARVLSPEEQDQALQKNIKLAEVTLMIDGVAIIVNKSNPVKKMSIEEAAAVFNGQITSWKQVGGKDEQIQLISLDPQSGLVSYLTRDVFKKSIDPEALVVNTP